MTPVVARRLIYSVLALAVLFGAWLMVGVDRALGRAGGGSSGFGGGGGFHGRGTGGFEGWLYWALGWAAFIAFTVITAYIYRRRRRKRRERIELAAAVAADDDPAFAPRAVCAAAEELFRAAQSAWRTRDEERLAELLVPDLLEEWRLRLADFEAKGWHNVVRVDEVYSVEYVGLVNRAGHANDRVTVRINAWLYDVVVLPDGRRKNREGHIVEGPFHGNAGVEEYWTLARDPERGWIVASIEDDKEGRHVLSAPIVATPWEDDERIGDAAVVEVAVADKLPEGMTTSDIASVEYADGARAAALDLSLADARWSPGVLEASARRAVAACAEAVDGADRDLLDVATPAAAAELLHPGDPTRTTRLVIRGAQVGSVRIVALDPAATPPTITVDVAIHGRRYVEDRHTAAVRSGTKRWDQTTSQRWTFALGEDDERPWQLVGVA